MRIRLILLLLFCSSFAFAQVENVKGTLLLRNGELAQGTVSYFYDDPVAIILRNEQNSRVVYHPDDVIEIQLENKQRFISQTWMENNTVKHVMMLQLLIESSDISLYKGDQRGVTYFFVSKAGQLQRLENNEKIFSRGDKQYKFHDRKYIGVLKILMADRKDLSEKIETTHLKEDEIKALILAYNKETVSYIEDIKTKKVRESNWLVFGQFSNYRTLYDLPVKQSYGFFIGLQYFYAKDSRHSFKFSLDHSTYRFKELQGELINLGIRYEFAMVKTSKWNLYFMGHILDMGHEVEVDKYYLLPKISPGLGLEVKPSSRFAMYAEINKFFQLKYLPRNFSVGMKYDFGPTTR